VVTGENVRFRLLILIVGVLSIWNCSADSGVAVSAEKEGSMFGKEEKTYVIASPLAGVLQRDGKPMANTRLLRRLTWSGNEEGILQEFFTDEQGRFSLPVHEEILSLNFLVQFVGKSKVYVEKEGSDHLIWYAPKLAPEIYSETDGPLEELVCDLDSERFVVNMARGNIMTRCEWVGMPE